MNVVPHPLRVLLCLALLSGAAACNSPSTHTDQQPQALAPEPAPAAPVNPAAPSEPAQDDKEEGEEPVADVIAPEEAPAEEAQDDGQREGLIKWVDLEKPAMVVRDAPTKKGERVGTVRRGRSFPVYEYKEGRGCKAPWARVGPGWVCSDHFVDAAGPPEKTSPLPFTYGIVYKDTEIFMGPHKHMGTGKIRKARSTVTILETTNRWVRTWPDQWLDKYVVAPREVRTSSLQGEHITEDTVFPLAFIRRNHTVGYPEPGLSKGEKRRVADDQKNPINRFTRTPVLEIHPKNSRRGGSHVRLEGGWVDRHQVGIVEPRPRPRGVGEDERWVLVDISEQTLVAYEGDKMVYATLISTGAGKSGPEAFTPVGKWRIHTKLRSSRMAGGSGASYHFLSDVPWVQYYYGGYALHGVYWHNSFGWQTSQGCINLVAHDAQWVFNWTGPHVPEGWYSFVQRGTGSWIVVVK